MSIKLKPLGISISLDEFKGTHLGSLYLWTSLKEPTWDFQSLDEYKAEAAWNLYISGWVKRNPPGISIALDEFKGTNLGSLTYRCKRWVYLQQSLRMCCPTYRKQIGSIYRCQQSCLNKFRFLHSFFINILLYNILFSCNFF